MDNNIISKLPLLLGVMPEFGTYIPDRITSSRPDYENQILGYESTDKEDVLIMVKYLVDKGFANQRLDIDKNAIQLTDKGRDLKKYGTIEDYENALIEENRKAQDRAILSDRLSRSTLLSNRVNLLISIGVTVAAIYYLLEILNHFFCFYSH